MRRGRGQRRRSPGGDKGLWKRTSFQGAKDYHEDNKIPQEAFRHLLDAGQVTVCALFSFVIFVNLEHYEP